MGDRGEGKGEEEVGKEEGGKALSTWGVWGDRGEGKGGGRGGEGGGGGVGGLEEGKARGRGGEGGVEGAKGEMGGGGTDGRQGSFPYLAVVAGGRGEEGGVGEDVREGWRGEEGGREGISPTWCSLDVVFALEPDGRLSERAALETSGPATMNGGRRITRCVKPYLMRSKRQRLGDRAEAG